jgi:hypothetical protein
LKEKARQVETDANTHTAQSKPTLQSDVKSKIQTPHTRCKTSSNLLKPVQHDLVRGNTILRPREPGKKTNSMRKEREISNALKVEKCSNGQYSRKTKQILREKLKRILNDFFSL